jgi:DNA replication protein DnaC
MTDRRSKTHAQLQEQIQTEILDGYLQSLKLPLLRRSYKQIAEECLNLGSSYEAYLYLLVEAEVLGRETRRVQNKIRLAGFPQQKTLENFDFKRLPNLDKKRVMDLMSSSYIGGHENILLLGNSGTGKTHLATALGLAACSNGKSVLFKTAAKLVHELVEAHDARQLLSLQKKLKAQDLLIIDELGFVPFSKTGAELLFEVFSEHYEKGSIIVTSNLPFEKWPEVFGCSRLTGALLDRLTHHVHILEMNGESYRLSSMTRQAQESQDKSV